jgi:dTDP-6-deoxy-L-talose 4-dehydrogenase (NAD+)
MRILLTGATGFIGNKTAEVAIAAGHEVLALCRNAGSTSRLPKGCHVAIGSLASPPWAEIEAFAPETAIHLAWIATPSIYLQSPENQQLVTESIALFQGLMDRGVSHLIGTGTCIEYAPSDAPLIEDRSPLGPTSPYAASKVETCAQQQKLADQAGIAWSWARIFYPYGEGEHGDRLPSRLIRQLSAGETLSLRTPDSIKDYIHVDDVASALLQVAERRVVGAVNIGTGVGVRIEDLAQLIADILERDKSLVLASPTPQADPFPVTVAETTKLRATGWQPTIDLGTGLRRLCQFTTSGPTLESLHPITVS